MKIKYKQNLTRKENCLNYINFLSQATNLTYLKIHFSKTVKLNFLHEANL